MLEEINYIKGSTKQHKDPEYIKNELAQYLQTENLSFLIGAGCSSYKYENYKEVGIPCMPDMAKSFYSDNPDFRVLGEQAEKFYPSNLEGLLEIMNAVNTVSAIKKIDSNANDKIGKIKEFIRTCILNGQKSEAVQQVYQEFYLRTVNSKRKTPISVFTTNYDMYNEAALDSLGFPYNNGFSGSYCRKFNPINYSYAYVENMNLSEDVWERVPTFFNLYKLHGSISWVNENEHIIEKDSCLIDDSDRVMIYPTPLKDRSTLMVPYSDLFRCMQNTLMKRNSILITLGYSFGDDHINRIILNSLAIPSFKLIVFGSGDSISALQALGDSRIIIINSEDRVHYFKRFVQELMPDVEPELQEVQDLAKPQDLISMFEESNNEQ